MSFFSNVVIFGDLISDFRSVTSIYLFKIVNIHFALLYGLHTIKPTLHLYMNLFVPVDPAFLLLRSMMCYVVTFITLYYFSILNVY